MFILFNVYIIYFMSMEYTFCKYRFSNKNILFYSIFFHLNLDNRLNQDNITVYRDVVVFENFLAFFYIFSAFPFYVVSFCV